jgi:asparagine N-glycosylation enzyme membrane subunit Stt3
MAFFLTTVPGQPPKVPIIDPLGMIGLLMMSFIFTLVMAGIGALWSWSLTTRNAEIRSLSALTFRLVTAFVLIAPFLLSFYLSIRTQ